MRGPIKILRIVTRLNIGGPAIHVSILSTKLDPKRFSTTVVAGTPSPGEGDLSELLNGGEATVVRLPTLRQPLAPIADLRALRDLIRLVWRERPELIHTHMAKAGTLGRAAGILYNGAGPGRRAGKRARLIHTFHGHVLEGYFSARRSQFFLSIERWLGRRTDCVIAVSARVQQDLLARGIGRPEAWRVIPLGLDLTALAALAPATGARPLRCGLIGRLVPIKHPELFIDAIGKLASSQAEPPVTGLVVGDGPLRASLEERVRTNNWETSVRFTGWRRDLVNVHRDLDIVCVTSWNEGTPVAMIEAMAAGRPVIATDVGGVRDVLQDANNAGAEISAGAYQVTDRGILIRAGDGDGLISALQRLADDKDLRIRLGEAGRRHVVSRFAYQRLLTDMAGLYEELAGKDTDGRNN